MGLFRKKKDDKPEEKKDAVSLEKLCAGTDLYIDLKFMPNDSSAFKTSNDVEPTSSGMLYRAIEMDRIKHPYARMTFDYAMILALWKGTPDDVQSVYDSRRNSRPNETPVPYQAIMSDIGKAQTIVQKFYELRQKEIEAERLRKQQEKA
jgi:hypothetical protein